MTKKKVAVPGEKKIHAVEIEHWVYTFAETNVVVEGWRVVYRDDKDREHGSYQGSTEAEAKSFALKHGWVITKTREDRRTIYPLPDLTPSL